MFTAQNADDMVECPYNKVHRMLRKRLQAHLLKCRLSYPDVELRKCPFNQTHLVPEPEFVHHVTNCTDRKLITQYKYDAPALESEEERVKQETVECEDNWDDTEAEDYNPNKYVEEAKVLRQAIGGLPTERKEFVKQERKRLGDYNSSDEEEEKKAKIKNDLDRPHSSDEEADYVYSSGRLRTPPPPPPINVQWFEDIKGSGDDDKSTTRRKEGKNRKTRDNGNRNRRNRRSRSRDRLEQGSSGSGSAEHRKRREQHNERNKNYALDDDPYYNKSDEFNGPHAPETQRDHVHERYDRPFYDRFC